MAEFAENIHSEDSNSPEVQKAKEKARKEFGSVFGTTMFSDVTFVVKDIEFLAHKVMLAVR